MIIWKLLYNLHFSNSVLLSLAVLYVKKIVHTKSDANKECNLSFSSANLLFFLPNDKMCPWTSKNTPGNGRATA